MCCYKVKARTDIHTKKREKPYTQTAKKTTSRNVTNEWTYEPNSNCGNVAVLLTKKIVADAVYAHHPTQAYQSPFSSFAIVHSIQKLYIFSSVHFYLSLSLSLAVSLLYFFLFFVYVDSSFCYFQTRISFRNTICIFEKCTASIPKMSIIKQPWHTVQKKTRSNILSSMAFMLFWGW